MFTCTPDIAASNLSTWHLVNDAEMLRSAFHDVVRDLDVNEFRVALQRYSMAHREAFDAFLTETMPRSAQD